MDNNTKRSKGFGYVTFKTREDLEYALEANGVVELFERALTVKVADGQRESRDSHSGRPPSKNYLFPFDF